MKSISRSFSLLFVVLAMLCCTSNAFADRFIAVSDYWCPYACHPGNMSGYIVDILKFSFKGSPNKLDYEIVPWQEALRFTTTGKYQALIGCTKDEAPNFIYPTEPVGYSSNDVFVKSDSNKEFKDVHSFANGILGAAFGYDYGDDVNWYILQNPTKVVLASTDKPVMENLFMLVNGKVDYIIGDKNVVEWAARQLGFLGNIKNIGSVGEPIPIFVGFTPVDKASPELAKTLDTGLAALRQSGKLQKILDKYSVKDWK